MGVFVQIAVLGESVPAEPGSGQNIVRELRRDRVLHELLLPGREVVNRQHDIGVLGDGLVAGAVQNDVLKLPGRHVAAIALSAFSRRQDVDQALAAGFDAHCAKPLKPLNLLQQILALVASAPAS